MVRLQIAEAFPNAQGVLVTMISSYRLLNLRDCDDNLSIDSGGLPQRARCPGHHDQLLPIVEST